eukprot:366412-Chlamydomonas_euryale.AAC.19
MDGWMDGWMDAWMHGWMAVWCMDMHNHTHLHSYPPVPAGGRAGGTRAVAPVRRPRRQAVCCTPTRACCRRRRHLLQSSHALMVARAGPRGRPRHVRPPHRRRRLPRPRLRPCVSTRAPRRTAGCTATRPAPAAAPLAGAALARPHVPQRRPNALQGIRCATCRLRATQTSRRKTSGAACAQPRGAPRRGRCRCRRLSWQHLATCRATRDYRRDHRPRRCRRGLATHPTEAGAAAAAAVVLPHCRPLPAAALLCRRRRRSCRQRLDVHSHQLALSYQRHHRHKAAAGAATAAAAAELLACSLQVHDAAPIAGQRYTLRACPKHVRAHRPHIVACPKAPVAAVAAAADTLTGAAVERAAVKFHSRRRRANDATAADDANGDAAITAIELDARRRWADKMRSSREVRVRQHDPLQQGSLRIAQRRAHVAPREQLAVFTSNERVPVAERHTFDAPWPQPRNHLQRRRRRVARRRDRPRERAWVQCGMNTPEEEAPVV